ncbi:unnamed protein product [Pedinophyceae sp. YPF-701]|nr:unnamed protein product [Pedinophyceae sp. YPF-701]
MPAALREEMVGGDDQMPLGHQYRKSKRAISGIHSRKERRKNKREEKKQHRVQWAARNHGGRAQPAEARPRSQDPPAKRARHDARPGARPGRAPSDAEPRVRRQSDAGGGVEGPAPKQMPVGANKDAFEAERRYMAQLEKKLGMRKRKSEKIPGAEDGLGDILKGLKSSAVREWGAPVPSGAPEADASDSGDDDPFAVLRRRPRRDQAPPAGREDSSTSGEGGDPFGMGGSSSEEDSDASEGGSEDGASDGSLEDADGPSSPSEGSESAGTTASGSTEADSDDDNDDSSGGEDREEAVQAPAERALSVPKAAVGSKYIPPALRAAQGGEATAAARRVRGLLNRLAEANMQGIVADVAGVYSEAGRGTVSRLVGEELVAAVSEGPRATDQFAATAAAFVAGFAAMAQSQEVAASFMARVARRLEEAVAEGDELGGRNLTMLTSYVYSAGLVDATTPFSLLAHLTQNFSEVAVTLMVTVLNACGLALRSDDPVAMRDFVVGVHKRAAEVGGGQGLSKRTELMLELVCEIKNNRRSAKASTPAGARQGGRTAVLSAAQLRWLRQLGVEAVQLRSVTWAKLLDRAGHVGAWWNLQPGEALPGSAAGALLGADAAPDAGQGRGGEATAAVRQRLDDLEGGTTSQELLRLAARMRMNTDVRRAVFCCVMGADGAADAAERLLALPLKGEQEREVMRVLLECCLSEGTYNRYYAVLAGRLAAVSRAHRTTLRYAVRDRVREVPREQPRRAANLARFVADCVAAFHLPLSVLESGELGEACGPGGAARERDFYRLVLYGVLTGVKSTADARDVFRRAVSAPGAGALRTALLGAVRGTVGPWVAERHADADARGDDAAARRLGAALQRARAVEKAIQAATPAAAKVDGDTWDV